MPTFLTISVGDRPQTAKPVVGTDDESVIKAALLALEQRCVSSGVDRKGG